jgi:hypothetical protein
MNAIQPTFALKFFSENVLQRINVRSQDDSPTASANSSSSVAAKSAAVFQKKVVVFISLQSFPLFIFLSVITLMEMHASRHCEQSEAIQKIRLIPPPVGLLRFACNGGQPAVRSVIF